MPTEDRELSDRELDVIIDELLVLEDNDWEGDILRVRHRDTGQEGTIRWDYKFKVTTATGDCHYDNVKSLVTDWGVIDSQLRSRA